MDDIKITKENLEQINDVLNDVKIPELIETNGKDTKIIRTRDWDDKDLTIISVTILGIISMIVLSDPSMILTSIISGLFGLAVGKRN
jgi:hypothetical protein